MQFFVLRFSTLALHIDFDRVFITMLSNKIHIKSFTPDLTTRQLFLHFCVFFKAFFSCYTFNQLYDFCLTVCRNTLNQKMNMKTFVCSELNELNLIYAKKISRHNSFLTSPISAETQGSKG
jgi:hypothetical protein